MDDKKTLAKRMRYLDTLIKSLPQGAKKKEAVALYRYYRSQMELAL